MKKFWIVVIQILVVVCGIVYVVVAVVGLAVLSSYIPFLLR